MTGGAPDGPGGGERAPQRLELLRYAYVEDILQRRAAHREGHLALVARRREQGRLVMAGAVGDPPTGALIVLAPGEAEAFMAADPYVAAGLVTSWRVEPWTVVT